MSRRKKDIHFNLLLTFKIQLTPWTRRQFVLEIGGGKLKIEVKTTGLNDHSMKDTSYSFQQKFNYA